MFLRLFVVGYSLACTFYYGTFRAFCTYALFPFAWLAWAWVLNKRPATRVEFVWSSCVFIIVWFVPLVIFYVYVGTYASPEPWGVFNTAVSPVGRSPCCSGGVSVCNGVPYHPAGYYGYGSQTPKSSASDVVSFCAVGRWADSNGLAPTGYNKKPGTIDTIGTPCVENEACDGLASTIATDYPNLGTGLRAGYYPGALITPTSLCPGVSRQVNARGELGKGLEICSRCARNRPTYCADTSNSQFFCFMCPGGYYPSEPHPMHYRDARFGAELLFGQFLLMLMSTFVAIPRCGSGISPKGYNAFF
jgi:hypothetical protein